MEIIVVISIMGLLSVVFSSFLISSLSSSSKTEIIKEVRQNGNYALTVMEGMILNSRSVSCPVDNDKTINVTDINGDNTVFLCSPHTEDGYISSNSASLTGSNITVLSCSFVCTQQTGKPAKVDINFKLSGKNTTNLRASEKASLDFNSTVVAKNF